MRNFNIKPVFDLSKIAIIAIVLITLIVGGSGCAGKRICATYDGVPSKRIYH